MVKCKKCNNNARWKGFCIKCYNKQYHEKYYKNNNNKIKQGSMLYYYKNRNKILNNLKIKYKKNSKFYIKKRHEYYENNKIKHNEYNKNRRKNDIHFKLASMLRNKLYSALKNKKQDKHDSALNLVGCSIKELKIYLEKQFKKGMSWNNHSKYGWHVDHIKPICTFDFSNKADIKKCFHYTNLQPLWAIENWKKQKGGKN